MEIEFEYTIPQEEVITIGQDFDLFTPERTNAYVNEAFSEVEGKDIEQFDSNILLSLHDIGYPNIPFGVDAAPSRIQKRYAITPFNPEFGYEITLTDLDPEERLAKLQQMKDELRQYIPLDQAPLGVTLSYHNGRRMTDLGIAIKEGPTRYRFPPEIQERLQRLRLNLMFPPPGVPQNEDLVDIETIIRPRLSFQTRLDPAQLERGVLEFKTFYPLATGPLATRSSSDIFLQMDEGLALYVPSDREKLRQIKGKFLLYP